MKEINPRIFTYIPLKRTTLYDNLKGIKLSLGRIMMRRQKGFTNIELIVVIVVLSIIAAIFIIRLPSSNVYSLASVTEQLKRDIRYTQTLAMSLNTSYSIIISSSNYTISPNPPTGAYTVTMPTGITLSTLTISFDFKGAPNAAGTVTVTASGTGSNTVTVAAETGFVS